MFLRILIFLLLWVCLVETCVKTIPPEEYYPSSTLPPEKCATCDVNEIAPENLQTGTKFDFTAIPTTGDCISTSARCSRTDGQECTSVIISSVTSTTSTVLGTASNAAEVAARLDCKDNGLYSSGMTTEVSRISCAFTGCELPCSTCDINLLSPTGLGTGEKFSFVEQGVAGACKQTQVTCARDDGLICESISINGPGTTTIASTSQSSTTSAVLTCQADKTYSSDAITAINQLSCVYTNCVTPCLSCDTAALTPTSLPTGAIFEFTETDGTCKSATVTCRRDDTATCTISISAISPMGTNVLGILPFATSVSSTLECGGDGLYSIDVITGISEISCSFTDCISCQTCDSSTILVSTPSGSTFEFTQLAPGAGGCVNTEVTCKRTDGLICSEVKIMGTTPSGTFEVASDVNTDKMSAPLNCQANGKQDISQLTCDYTECKMPCELCGITKLAPTGLPAGEKFDYFEDGATGGCKRTEVACYRDDGKSCATLSGPGSIVLASDTEGSGVAVALDCQNDQTYSVGAITEITELSCSFTDCKFECEACNLIEPVPMAGISFSFVDSVGPGGCKVTEITCTNDNEVCAQAIISAQTSSGEQILNDVGADVSQVSTTLQCQGDKSYSGGGFTQIGQLTCTFNGCSPKPTCESCDILSIVPTGLEAGTNFEYMQTSAAGTCKTMSVKCVRTDGEICDEITMEAVSDIGTFPIASGTTEAESSLECQANGKFADGPYTGIVQINCDFDC